MNRLTIEIDHEIFEFLQEQARAFVDSPNDVLRRLLLEDSPRVLASRGATQANSKEDVVYGSNEMNSSDTAVVNLPSRSTVSAGEFVREFLREEFGEEEARDFSRVGRYRMMFESSERLVYVQNFNKSSTHLWYRVTEKPWKELQETEKNALLCFTNPAERFAYILPVRKVAERVGAANWDRDYLEVNIDPVSSRWIELGWKIDDFLKQY